MKWTEIGPHQLFAPFRCASVWFLPILAKSNGALSGWGEWVVPEELNGLRRTQSTVSAFCKAQENSPIIEEILCFLYDLKIYVVKCWDALYSSWSTVQKANHYFFMYCISDGKCFISSPFQLHVSHRKTVGDTYTQFTVHIISLYITIKRWL